MPLVYFLISSGFLSFYDVPAFMVPGKTGGWDIRSIFERKSGGGDKVGHVEWGGLGSHMARVLGSLSVSVQAEKQNQ